MPELTFALYTSEACGQQSNDFYNEILRVSQHNNKRDDLTGFLHREEGFFIQYLEGPKTKLFDRLAKIGRDPRHKRFEIMDHGPLEKRMVPDWQMGFVAGDQLQLGDLLEISDGKLTVRSIEAFDLVIFLVNNAELLREANVAA